MRLLISLFVLFCGVTYAQDDPVRDSQGREYFPKGKGSYYARYLSAMKESSLQRDLKKDEDLLFRFTYLRSFDDPLLVSLIKRKGAYEMRVVRLGRDNEGRILKITHDEQMRLSDDSAKTIDGLLDNKGFWKALSPAEKFCEGLDGSRWVFEIHDSEGYRMIDPWSPATNSVPNNIDFPKLLKEEGIKVSKLRDYKVYVDVGYKLLEMAKILPKSEDRY